MKKAWGDHCSKLSDKERTLFESHACNGLTKYVEEIEAAYQRHRDSKHALLKFQEWFEPIFKAVELFTPAAAVAIQAYPNPGSLVLGGVVGILQITSRLLDYQKRTVQMLERMGRKTRVFLDYKNDIYKDDIRVQKALINVYGDILTFCQKAFKFMTKHGRSLARVRGMGLILFRDYESQFEKEIHDFEAHLEDVESFALLCDKKRLEEVRRNEERQLKKIGEVFTENHKQFQRASARDETMLNFLKREQESQERRST